MKLPFAKIIVVTMLFAMPAYLNAGDTGKDFLITLNGSKLTGNIKVRAILTYFFKL